MTEEEPKLEISYRRARAGLCQYFKFFAEK